MEEQPEHRERRILTPAVLASALFVADPLLPIPPASSTLPFGRRVVVANERPFANALVALQAPVAGS